MRVSFCMLIFSAWLCTKELSRIIFKNCKPKVLRLRYRFIVMVCYGELSCGAGLVFCCSCYVGQFFLPSVCYLWLSRFQGFHGPGDQCHVPPRLRKSLGSLSSDKAGYRPANPARAERASVGRLSCPNCGNMLIIHWNGG